MALKIWLDTGLVEEKDAKISVFDHGLLYGDGVFEGIRVYGGRVFELDAHIRRLFESARAIRLPMAMSKEELTTAVETTVKANNVADGYIRLVVTRGVGTLGLNPFTCKKSSLFIIADKIQLYPEELYEKGMKVISATTVRNHPLALPAQVKSLNYLNNILAKIEALDSNVPEAIMYNHEGYVAEATGDNVFIVKNRVVYTPPVEAGGLEGVTPRRGHSAGPQGGPGGGREEPHAPRSVRRRRVLPDRDGGGGHRVVQIDGRTVGDGAVGPVTRRLAGEVLPVCPREGAVTGPPLMTLPTSTRLNMESPLMTHVPENAPWREILPLRRIDASLRQVSDLMHRSLEARGAESDLASFVGHLKTGSGKMLRPGYGAARRRVFRAADPHAFPGLGHGGDDPPRHAAAR